MPAYPWLFEIKNEVGKAEIEVIVPDNFRKGINGKILQQRSSQLSGVPTKLKTNALA
jgi:cytochrome c oxidase cbb3-type subunit 2